MVYGGQRLELSSGEVRRRSTKIVLWAVLGPVLACLCGVVGTIAGLIIGSVADLSDSAISGLSFVTAAIVCLAGAAYAVYQIVVLARSAAWLEDGVLSVRRLRTKSVSLASARVVRMSANTETQRATRTHVATPIRTPYLSVSDETTTVHLRLRGPDDGLLPPAEFRALADALSAATCPGAAEAQSWLRAIAADPRSLFS
jgi:hypothetical protein